MNPYLRGAASGAVATVFHTAVMLALHRALPRARREPVPPVQITAQLAERAGARPIPREAALTAASAVLHFGYGAATGALYGPLAERDARLRSAAAGAAYGAGVWAASYLGWIPAVGLLTPATRHPAQRNLMMILAHVAWGTALSLAYRRLSPHKAARRG